MRIENIFMDNLNERELRKTGRNTSLVSDMHLAYMDVNADCPFAGRRLMDSDLRKEYGINLQKIKNEELHWWEFLALFDSLPDDSKIVKIMYWRTCSTSGLPRKEVERLNELKERYKLVDEESVEEKISLELRNQKMQEYVQKRYEEVGMCEQEKPGRN